MQRILEVLQKRVRVLEMGTLAITGVYARGLFFKKRLNSTRAGQETRSFRIPGEPRSPAPRATERCIPAKLQTRPRHKRQPLSATQSVRFNVPASAFVGVSANATNARGNRSFPPRPSPPVGAGRGGTPVGRQSLPQGEPLPAFSLAKTFSSSLGKVDPAEQKQIKNYSE